MFDRDLNLKREISQNIKDLMKRHNWTQVKLSEESGISKSTLSDYIRCKTLINPGNVEKLSETFGVPKHEIDPSFKTQTNTFTYDQFEKVPVVDQISCGNGNVVFESVEGYETTPKEWVSGGKHFYMRAKGESMKDARIHDGDLLLIREQSEVEHREIAAVLVGDEMLLKRVYYTNDSVILQPENSKYDPIVLKSIEEARIIGKLKKVVLEF